VNCRTDILIYVEDPGAANFVASFPEALAQRGWQYALMTRGTATDYLSKQGIASVQVPATATAAQLLDQVRPRLLLVGTSEDSDSIGLELVLAARRAGIVSVGVVDSAANADYRFRGRTDNPRAYSPDWVLVPDLYARDRFLELGFSRGRVLTCGHPHHDRVRAVGEQLARRTRAEMRGAHFPGAGSRQPIFVFVTEISAGLNPAQFLRSPEYTLVGRGRRSERTAIILEEFLDAAKELEPKPYLVLRLHPKEIAKHHGEYLSEFHQVSKEHSGLEVVYAADLVAGMTSMLLQEAALLGRPTLAILPRLVEKEWLTTIRCGITPCVTAREPLRAWLKQWALSDRPIPIPESCCELDGSLHRAVAAIEQVLRGPREPERLVR
jgi:hypothetical protein